MIGAPSRRGVAAVLVSLAVLGSLASCGVDAAEQASPSSSPATTGTPARGGSSTTAVAPTTTPGSGVDPNERDVADRVFSGQGDPRIDVHTYSVTVAADPGSPRISGRVVMTLAATTAVPLRSFTLDLRGPTISSAQVDGKPARVAAGADQVEVVPVAPLAPGHEVSATFTYAGTPRPTTFPRLGAEVGWQRDGDGGWFTMSEPNGTNGWFRPWDTTGIERASTVQRSSDASGRAKGLWTVEMRIPFAALSPSKVQGPVALPNGWKPALPPINGASWKFNFARANHDTPGSTDSDYSLWSFAGSFAYGPGKPNMHFHDQNNFGVLTFGLRP